MAHATLKEVGERGRGGTFFSHDRETKRNVYFARAVRKTKNGGLQNWLAGERDNREAVCFVRYVATLLFFYSPKALVVHSSALV